MGVFPRLLPNAMNTDRAPDQDGLSRRPLTLQFKGGRNYLHGTDFFEALASHSRELVGEAIEEFSMTIHRIVRHQPDLVWSGIGRHPPPRSATAAVEFAASGPEGAFSGWLEETSRSVSGRYPYDEDALGTCCELRQNSIACSVQHGFSPIEAIVAANKLLHQHLFRSVGGRWMFTKLVLRRWLRNSDSAALELVLLGHLHKRLTRSEIRSGGEMIGLIFFSVVTQ